MSSVYTHGRWVVKPGKEHEHLAKIEKLFESFEPSTLDRVASVS